MLFSDCVDNFELEIFGIVLVRHITCDNALEEVFVDASCCDVVDDCFHALHEVVGVPIVAVMHKEPHSDCQGNTLVGILKIVAGA